MPVPRSARRSTVAENSESGRGSQRDHRCGCDLRSATRRFLQRHLDGCAIMRCLGASQGQVMRLYITHFVLLGLVASAVGCVLGVAAQAALARWLGGLVAVQLPAPGGCRRCMA